MRWFYTLVERLQQRRRKPLVIRTVPEAMRPERVVHQPEEDPQAPLAVDTHFGFSDSLSLAIDDQPQANPYDTHTWELDPAQDTRQLKKVDVIDRPRPKKVRHNPYNTGEFRKGWGGK